MLVVDELRYDLDELENALDVSALSLLHSSLATDRLYQMDRMVFQSLLLVYNS